MITYKSQQLVKIESLEEFKKIPIGGSFFGPNLDENRNPEEHKFYGAGKEGSNTLIYFLEDKSDGYFWNLCSDRFFRLKEIKKLKLKDFLGEK